MNWEVVSLGSKLPPRVIITNSNLGEPGVHDAILTTTEPIQALPILYANKRSDIIKTYSELPSAVTPELGDYILIEHASNINRFLLCMHNAYATHSTLSIRPDDLWLLILSGMIIHQQNNDNNSNNSQQNRSKLVPHVGEIGITCSAGVENNLADNNWNKIIKDFENQIQAKIDPNVYNYIICNYSASPRCTCYAGRVGLMSMLDSYYDYSLVASCGFKSIILEGLVDDWKRVLYRAKNLANLGLEWWSKHLVPVIEKIVDTFEGAKDELFWQSMYKFDSVSNNTYGWFNVFFPFKIVALNTPPTTPTLYTRNDIVWSWKSAQMQKKGLKLVDYPLCIYSVDLRPDMKIFGGFTAAAVTQSVPRTFRPSTGYIVAFTMLPSEA